MGNKKIVRNRLTFEELTWDTDYFGIPSAKFILIDSINGDDIEFINDVAVDYQFNTIQNIGNIASNNRMLTQLHGAFLTDINVQFGKILFPFKCHSDEHITIDSSYHNTEITEISRESFVYSRFFNDPFLDKNKSKNVYVKWVESAFNQPDRFFAVYREQIDICGFLLFNYDMAKALSTIELIAVNKNCSRKGIGSKLMQSLEEYLIKNQISRLNVGTQVDNLKAIDFYHKMGFKMIKVNSVFHYWPGRKDMMR